jgi:type IV pilus assembly protein PilY1
MKKLIITLILFILILSNKAYSKLPPPGTGTSGVPANILIMLDNSGSMSWDINGSVISSWRTLVSYPMDVAIDSSGNIYAIELNTRRIKVFDSSGSYLRQIGGGYGYGCNQFIYAYQIAAYGNELYIWDFYRGHLKVLDGNGSCKREKLFNAYWQGRGLAVNENYIFQAGSYHSYMRVLNRSNLNQVSYIYDYWKYYSSWGLNINSDGTKMVMANHSTHTVCVMDISGTSLGNCQLVGNGRYGGRNGYFYSPTDADFDSNGNIYVTDLQNHRIQKFNSSRKYVSKYGSRNYSGNPFYYPYGLAISSDDKIYVADWGNKIHELTTGLTYTGAIGVPKSRMSMAKDVIKKIVSNTELTSGANFGLMEWGWPYKYNYLNLRVPINSNGAKTIYTNVDGVRGYGGTYLLQAMNYAKQYWSNGAQGYPSPRIPNATCQLNFNILISDGQWNNHSSAMSVVRDMKNSLNVKTFAVGFAVGTGNRGNYDDLADNGGTVDALYANSSAQLLTALTDAIKQAISGTLTFTTPAVMSELQKGDFVYQSTFKYEKYKQWEGSLKKHKLNSNGSFGALQWDAAEKLNNKSPNSRNLWTINAGSTGVNNFTTSNRSILKKHLFPNKTSPTDSETDDLINFIRGFDTYDTDKDNSTSDERHKLADIYHSELIVVGKPDSSTADNGNINYSKTDAYYRQQKNYNNFKNSGTCGGPCNSRTEAVIAGANSGILHAFRASDGQELWGYIPPNIIGKLSTIVTTKANATNPIHGIDGSPVVKDIYFDDTPNNSVVDPRWRTVLISGLGAGGNGYFALDITDINNPKHLFAIENDTLNKVVKHWDNDESSTIYGYSWGNTPPEQYDYSKLGESWSTPRIMRIKVNGADRWVAVFGAGYNSKVAPEYGSAIFIADLENEGKILKRIDIKDNQNASHKYVFSVNKDIQEFNMSNYGLNSYNYKNQKLIVSGPGSIGFSISQNINGDIASNIKIVLEQELPVHTNFEVTVVNRTDIVNSVPSDLVVITADGTPKANYDGALIYAADLEGKITKVNLTENFLLNNNLMINKDISTTTLFNSQSTSDNGRYIFKGMEATINNDNNLWLYFGTGDTQKIQDQSNKVQNRVFGIKDVNFPNFVAVNPAGNVSKCKTAPTCPGGSDLGWYINLEKSQKLTATPTIDRDRAYFTIYEPTDNNNACKTGKAILKAYDSKCGNALLNVNLGSGVLSKVVIQGDNLYIGLSGEANKNIAGFTSKDNLITGKSKAKAASGAVQLESWKENY